MQGLPYNTKGRSKDLVQQIDTKFNQHLQGAKCPIHLALHRGAQVQEVYSMLNEHQAAGG